jgi:hypothetical protein
MKRRHAGGAAMQAEMVKRKSRDIVDRLRAAAGEAESRQQSRLLLAGADAIDELRIDCAEAYLVVGAMGLRKERFTSRDVVRALDNLAAAASGWPRKHKDLVPWPKSVPQRKQSASPARKTRKPRK